MAKKSQSQIVGTVLLILIVIVAAVIIMSFVVPFANKQLKKGDCFEVINEIEIRNNPKYTCYDNTNNHMNIQIHVGDVSKQINGFAVELGGAASRTYEILNRPDNNISDVKDYDELDTEFGKPLKFPGDNEERTYVFNYDVAALGMISSVDVYPILTDGQTCESASILKKIVFCE